MESSSSGVISWHGSGLGDDCEGDELVPGEETALVTTLQSKIAGRAHSPHTHGTSYVKPLSGPEKKNEIKLCTWSGIRRESVPCEEWETLGGYRSCTS